MHRMLERYVIKWRARAKDMNGTKHLHTKNISTKHYGMFEPIATTATRTHRRPHYTSLYPNMILLWLFSVLRCCDHYIHISKWICWLHKQPQTAFIRWPICNYCKPLQCSDSITIFVSLLQGSLKIFCMACERWRSREREEQKHRHAGRQTDRERWRWRGTVREKSVQYGKDNEFHAYAPAKSNLSGRNDNFMTLQWTF